ncbi:glycosyltransferase family 4 protein [Subsaximicrobium wynnwilliamsii]|uniref:Glycosyltransferase family 4 protein n=1 Tax=Subsaximicrobium wynnwilliamsii TaxID=291179 RepID=A0A5C6ZIM9_9FLAO|nr:glycosyltransferase [Subsaximicrobium wynnwilliamsii]TXD81359.1 glycosyltransferase family 4 protein [Subsaximicrobium wynnwilliamsii]TXD89055.1 glycosyltransferase family 4 protein [Subsaximicrobium wynnwilliamsii]TXE00733.1 glycosyltransferase family 4 protein [Subsaximicrobium wynnwilliamsii]
MILYYFGADTAWHEQSAAALNRRNMALLFALSNQESISTVYNVIRSTRSTVFKNRKKQKLATTKIINVYVAPIFPERGFLNHITRPINRMLLKMMHPKVFEASTVGKKLAWCYWPKGFEDFEFMGIDMELIFDTDHNIIDEPNIGNEKKEERRLLLLRAGKKAKYILSSSRSMINWYQQYGLSNTKILMNGLFEERVNLTPNLKENKNYVVTYCGTLSKWLKLDWLFKILHERPEWSFNFIGANYQTDITTQLEEFSNVNLCGFLNPKQVDEILKQSDVCFGLYQKDPSVDVNSMKLYDYLAQGIPVVVNNYHSNLKEDFNDLLNIANTYEEFESLLANPKQMNLNKVEQFLEASTWNYRVKNIINGILA